jgi:prepilin-type N-terminal cleavage/methylation domain-containing protein
MFSNYLVSHKRPRHIRQGGFGLIELMVSISVVTIVTSVILVRQSSFNSAVLLRNQTYDVALNVREVQLSAVTTGRSSIDFRAILGIHFDTNTLDNDRYILFQDADASPNGFYDVGEETSAIFLDERFEIREIRAGADTPSALSVIFVRPNFDARFFDATNSEVLEETIEIDIARRGVVGTDDGVLRTVEITATGQITVQ